MDRLVVRAQVSGDGILRLALRVGLADANEDVRVRAGPGPGMAVLKRGKYWYVDTQADIWAGMLRYSKAITYLAQHYVDPVCNCGRKLFRRRLDDTQGAALRACVACGAEHPLGDSGD